MATMNYYLTICRAAEEKYEQKIQGNSTKSIGFPKSPSDNNGIQLFGHFFSFGSAPNTSTSFISNPIIFKSMNFADIDENSF
ncbi:unnamed protein product [Rotaria magnacalcarata]|uniref:Uncharacterized protein n=1 Tax=Rotaria magnacalcarata TaxID=392030 RepID=A0A816N2U5_9BILA|nr:unnamed protein product [Rotaria magnacalcarata]CAF2028203.1 unnamed protein product [Rotaria magnacalcarata]CAF2131952.1 unnamed protein product [Rotaria magnacalcarata]CAF3765356.1 unnamed protein product [Rotaria magnacalcarata]CAF3781608.1 unnamed protein product [Rotaria magnacalcarata]